MSDAHAGPVVNAAGSHDAHGGGHAESALGPIDVMAWSAGILGIVIGLVMALAFIIATNRLVI